MPYRVVKDFTIDPFRFKAGEPVTEVELYPFKQTLLEQGCVKEDAPAPAPLVFKKETKFP